MLISCDLFYNLELKVVFPCLKINDRKTVILFHCCSYYFLKFAFSIGGYRLCSVFVNCIVLKTIRIVGITVGRSR